MPTASSAKKAPAKKAAAKKAPPKKKAAPAKKAAVKKAAVKKKAPAKKAPAKKALAKKAAPAKKTAAVKKKAAPARKAAASKAPAKKAAAAKESAPAKKAPAKKAAPAKKPAPSKKAAPPKKKPKPLDRKFLESQRELLLHERKRLWHDVETLDAEADELALMREPGDAQFDEESGEGDTLAVERERDLALSAQFRSQIEDIDHALAKIDVGTYGFCEVSGLLIPKDRLRAIPWARERVEYKVGGFQRR